MDKINFVDRQLENPELLNRYRLNPVSGQSEVYDIAPEQGAVIQEGTPVRALELNQMQTNIEAGIETTIAQRSAAVVVSASGGGSIFTISAPSTANPNRITIIPNANVSSGGVIQFTSGMGEYYPIVEPNGSTTSYVTRLQAWVPYDLVLANINGTLRWVRVGKWDTMTRAEKLADLGIYKTLWSGTGWTSGSKTISGLQDYNAFVFQLSGNSTCWATRQTSGIIRGGGSGYVEGTSQYLYSIEMSPSGSTLTYGQCIGLVHRLTGHSNSSTSLEITQVIGLF